MKNKLIDECIELGRTIRLGKIYPTAHEIVDTVERCISQIELDESELYQAAKMIQEATLLQAKQDWLGVADFLEYDLPDFAAEKFDKAANVPKKKQRKVSR